MRLVFLEQEPSAQKFQKCQKLFLGWLATVVLERLALN